MDATFINRVNEIRVLEDWWNSGKPHFIVVYGRRRVGKTRLLKEFLRNKLHIYYLCHLTSHDVNLSRLVEKTGRVLGLKGLEKTRFNALNDFLELLSTIVEDRLIIVLDEFTYWVRVSPQVLSELQQFIDEKLMQTRFMIIVCGSLVGIMHREVVGGGSPLYGRRTGTLKVEELEPWYVKDFLPNYSKVDRVKVYSLVGGIPFYLQLFDRNISLNQNILNLFVKKTSPIYNEVDFLLREEFRAPQVYISILSAIARGENTPQKISNIVGIDRSHISKYLKVLLDLNLVQKIIPLWSKKGYYRVRDKLVNTWFKLVEPVLDEIESENIDIAYQKILDKIDIHVSQIFEELVLKYLLYLRRIGKLRFTEIGKYLHKGVEIDYIALDEEMRKAYLIEVKWRDLKKQDIERISRQLDQKAPYNLLEKYQIDKIIVARKAPKNMEIKTYTLKEIPI